MKKETHKQELDFNIKDIDMKKLLKHKSIQARLMTICMIGAMIVVLLLNYIIDGIKETEEDTIKSMKSETYDHMIDHMDILIKDASSNIRCISKSIEKDIKQSNMNSIKDELDKGEFSEELYDIIRKNIDNKNFNDINNFRNGIVVITPNGIYEDLNISRASDSEIRNWEYEIDRAYNKELESDAINKLLTHSNDIIITEPNNLLPKGTKHRLIDTYDKEKIREIYLSEGIEGLKNYQIWVPVYITDSGDIFGQKDIINGKKQPTHKIIVIQEFNLYDQIKETSPLLYKSLKGNDDINDIQIRFHYIILFMYIIGIIYVLELVVGLFYFCSIYNSMVNKYELDKEDHDK